mmetsp:Transcript_53784/g.148594  ORF Transcript_53784/g.148594 Transcript_53784/m.148594 type:complete len:481 (-) Transcript_53784:236-1678(-)
MAQAIIPNQLVDGRHMMEAIGEVLEGEENEDDNCALLDEIAKRVAAGGGWAKDERQAYLDNLANGPELPLFSDNAEDADPALIEALASLKYDDDESPLDMAIKCKENGNSNFKRAAQIKKKMYFREALKHYTEGCLHIMKARELDDSEENRALHAALLANRGACNMSLKNFGSVKRDCTDALKLTPNNIKAHFRIAKACFELKQFENSLKAITTGLEVEGEAGNSELLALRNKADAELAKARKREADKRKAIQREEEALLLLYERCAASGATLGPAVAADGYSMQHGDKLPLINEADGSVSWPMLFLYPQYFQSDFVEAVSEDQMLLEYMAMVFPEGDQPTSPWDEHFEYKCSELEVYFQVGCMPAFSNGNEMVAWSRLKKEVRGETSNLPTGVAAKRLEGLEKRADQHPDDQTWVKIHPACTMGDLIKYPEHVLAGGVLTLHMYPKNSEAHRNFVKACKAGIKELMPSAVNMPPPVPGS